MGMGMGMGMAQGGQAYGTNRASSYSLDPSTHLYPNASTNPNSNPNLASGAGNVGARPPSFLPDVGSGFGSEPINLGAEGITETQLEASVRSICAGADLDTLTKKGVRKRLEEEYGVSLASRKEAINRIIERVLNGESCWRSPDC
jgi:chitin synthase